MGRLPVAFALVLWHPAVMERLFDAVLGFVLGLFLPAWELPPDFREARRAFPYALTETSGAAALARWRGMRDADGTVPLIVGPAEDALPLMRMFQEDAKSGPMQSTDDILQAADAIDFPEDLFARNRAMHAEFIAEMEAEDPEFVDELGTPDEWAAQITGEWPETPPEPSQTLALAHNWLDGAPHPRVFIAQVPTPDQTALPAWVRFGGWNLNPQPEMHVAAFRDWNARYGAVPVAMSGDVIEMEVTRRPATREDALTLAREMYEYCPDIVDQGSGTLSALAATLMVSDLWYFWWD
ncbi:DUF4253 domain-containing protein [Maritimibacter sp. UBA3975]|uniref:DUF4253 domain-containing protein n=1 Tax=Maritimibacter sp. UBA3975 TaxID=1946833 RepID=UPI0025C33B52|nr:DUF4253 domain-containing protein [Maritimibacter sp. UBA3975]